MLCTQLHMVVEKLKASLQPGSLAEILLYRTHQQLQARGPPRSRVPQHA